MYRAAYYLLLVTVLFSCAEKLRTPVSEEEKNRLIHDLIEIRELDQKYRNKATELRVRNKGIRTGEEGKLWADQSFLDSVNMIRMEKIIEKYGYPGADIVGNDLKSVGLLVIAHSPKKQENYIRLLWKEAKKGNVEKKEVAMLDDRIKMLNGKKQRYGTALIFETIGIDSSSGNAITKLRIWDIKRFKGLDKRRENVGWYSFRLQCEIEGLDWEKFEKYVPEKTIYDFELK